MENDVNLYKPPETPVEPETETQGEAYFFTTSSLKLALMSLCTLGLYELYWFYKNWVLIKARTEKDIMPFWRAFFAPFWAYSCFESIKVSANENDVKESLPIGILAIIYLVLQIAARLPEPFWLGTLLTFAVMLPVNAVALKINRKMCANFSNNDKFSAWNWGALVVGGLFLALILLGTFLPGPV